MDATLQEYYLHCIAPDAALSADGLLVVMWPKKVVIIIYVTELGHLLTRSGLTYPEVSSKVYHDSFCQLGISVSLPCVIYFEGYKGQRCVIL